MHGLTLYFQIITDRMILFFDYIDAIAFAFSSITSNRRILLIDTVIIEFSHTLINA